MGLHGLQATTAIAVARGGSWILGPDLLRAAKRAMFFTNDRVGSLGFRVGRTLR